ARGARPDRRRRRRRREARRAPPRVHELPGPADDVLVQVARGGAALPRHGRRPALGDLARVPRLRLPAGRRKDDVEAARARAQLSPRYEKIFAIASVSSSAPTSAPPNSATSIHGGSARADIAAARSQSVCGYCSPTGDIRLAACAGSNCPLATGRELGGVLGARSAENGRCPPGTTG